MGSRFILFAEAGRHVVEPRVRTVDEARGVKIPRIVPGVSIRVPALSGGDDAEGRPLGVVNPQFQSHLPGGRIHGMLSVSGAAEETGLSEQDIIDFFFTGKNAQYRGVKWEIVDESGIRIDLDKSHADEEPGIDPWASMEVTSKKPKMYYCHACQDEKTGRGAAGHVISKVHLAALASWDEAGRPVESQAAATA